MAVVSSWVVSAESAGKKLQHEAEISLARRAMAGERAALDRFLESVCPRLMLYSRLVCGSQEDAEDVSQATLVRAYECFHKLRAAEAVHVWIFRIAKNCCLMMRRRRRPAEPGVCRWMPRAILTPEERAIFEEREGIIKAAVEGLPKHYRMAVLLHYWEGLPAYEIASALEVQPDVVRAWLSRARKSILRTLQESAAPHS